MVAAATPQSIFSGEWELVLVSRDLGSLEGFQHGVSPVWMAIHVLWSSLLFVDDVTPVLPDTPNIS